MYLFQGMLIGLLFGVPVGAVGAMTVQRTLNHGVKAGLLTGMGSSVADYIYACVGVFGLTMVSDFLLNHQTIINVIGGGFILAMGIRVLAVQRKFNETKPIPSGKIKMFLSSFVVGVTNPAAILTFLFAFTYFGISSNMGILSGLQLVIGVFIGTYIWWGLLSILTAFLKKKLRHNGLKIMDKVSGAILILFGGAILIRTIL